MTTETYRLQEFIADVDEIAREEQAPEVVAQRVAPLLARLVRTPDCVPPEFRRRPATGRGRYMLHRASHFNVTSVVWGPGDSAEAHNHETWGVIGVLENEIQETRYRVLELGAVGTRATIEVKEVLRHHPGAVSCLVPGDDVHAMHNVTDRDTVEIHVYGKDLAGLPRRRVARDGSVQSLVTPKYLNC
jgi:predicted metal-dependent enzyme (double-stranded beta helix superfamily)